MENHRNSFLEKYSKIIFISILFIQFALLFSFINIQQEKYSYLIYLYGDTVSPGSISLLKVFSKDGEVVTNPNILINGKKHESHLLNLNADLREIHLKVGSVETVFPVRYRDIAERSVQKPNPVQFSQSEISNLPEIPMAGERHLFLVPNPIKIVPEFETTVYLYCIEKTGVCKDRTVFVNNMEKELKNGFASFKTTLTTDNSINILFKDGTSVTTQYPFYGKQFKFTQKEGDLWINSLIDTSNVHIDCFQSGKWIKTDIIHVSSSGQKLPSDYRYCDRIQASFNSADPGGTFAVHSRGDERGIQVTDRYYAKLFSNLDMFSEYAQDRFLRSYETSFFIPLTILFSGEILEEKFLEDQREKLSSLWWAILTVSFLSLIFFVVVMYSKFRVVEGLDGELVTLSLGKQKAMLAFAVCFYTIVIVGLLYLLKNLA
jgi:hypothetical protein